MLVSVDFRFVSRVGLFYRLVILVLSLHRRMELTERSNFAVTETWDMSKAVALAKEMRVI